MQPFRFMQGDMLPIFGSCRFLVWNLFACCIYASCNKGKDSKRKPPSYDQTKPNQNTDVREGNSDNPKANHKNSTNGQPKPTIQRRGILKKQSNPEHTQQTQQKKRVRFKEPLIR